MQMFSAPALFIISASGDQSVDRMELKGSAAAASVWLLVNFS